MLHRGLTSQQQSIPLYSWFAPNYVYSRGDNEENHFIARNRVGHPSHVELFSLQLILLEGTILPPKTERSGRKIVCTTFRSPTVAMRRYADGNEFEKCFGEAVRMYLTPSSAKMMQVRKYVRVKVQ